MKSLHRRACGVLCVLGVLAWTTQASAQIRWQSGTSDLSGQTRAEMTARLSAAALRGANSHLVMQFSEPLTPQLQNSLRAAGVNLQSYLGDNAYFASVGAQAVDEAAVAGVATLIDVQEIETAWKLHPVLARGERPEWAVVPAPQDGPAPRGAGEDAVWIGAYVLFHKDVALQNGLGVVESHTVRVRDHLETVNGLVIELPLDEVPALAAEDAVMFVEPALPRMSENNNSNRIITQANTVQAFPYSLDGAGVSVLVYDGGTARASHQDFGGRATVRDSSGRNYHATHVAGTVGGSGAASGGTYRGMAPGVTIESYGFEYDGSGTFLYTNPGDIEDDYDEAINVYGADISNNSIGTNTAPNGFPCSYEGDYGTTATVIDSIVSGSLGAPFRIVWANGNERGSGRCGTTYHTTAPPACAKNHITVGALNSNDDSVTSFTSWGPCDDDRMKPDVAGPGCQSNDDSGVTSTHDTSDTAYNTLCGTSMAAPTVTGLSALLLEDYRAQYPGDPDFRNSTLKALLAHNARDIEETGPDYKSGYGSVRIQDTIDFMRTGNFFEAQTSQGGTVSVLVVVNPGDPELKVTLAWDDPPGTPNVSPALVNDLDLRVFDPSATQHFPWTLGGLANPSAPAVRTQADHVNNIEQVFVSNPQAGTWVVEIHGFNVPQGPQAFSVCASPQLNQCSSAGIIALDAPSYSCNSTVGIRVVDCDLNTNESVVETVSVTISSLSEPGGESVLLTETAAETADFRGSITTSTTNSPGVLRVANGDSITATYIDADDGAGGTLVPVTAMASVDCQGPVITNVQVSEISSETATVTFDTNESAIGTVRYGTACGSLTGSAVESGSGTTHSVMLSGLTHSTRYYFAVDAEDAQGNVGTNDNGGACYAFSTSFVLYDFPLDGDPGWTTAGDWAFGQPSGGGSSAGDPSSGYTGNNVYGYNLAGDYPNNLPATYLTTTELNCSGWSDVRLKFRRWLGVESNSNFDDATVEVSNNGTNWTVIFRATDGGVDISDSSWQLIEYDISAIADNEPTVFVRWGMGPTDGGLTYPGWNLDDIQILASGGPLSITFPNGLPDVVPPSTPTDIDVRIIATQETYVPGTAMLHYRFDGGTFQTAAMTPLGGDMFRATLPAAGCGQNPEFYFSAQGSVSGIVTQPPTAPSTSYSALVGEFVTLFSDNFETNMGWTVSGTVAEGDWERGVPENNGRGDPPADYDGSGQCYLTENDPFDSNSDVDNGTTILTSPVLDLSGGGTINYAYWFNDIPTGPAGPEDPMTVEVATNASGTNWTQVRNYGSVLSAWRLDSIDVGTEVTPSSTIRVRFMARDLDPQNVIECGLDAFVVTRFECVASATCDDGIQNQGEDRIDCGGPCPACACTTDGACDNGTFCDGSETCDAFGDCQPGTDPCPGQLCRESDDTCVNCLDASDCTDGTFCNGAETCDPSGNCQPGSDPCPGQLCRETDDMCVNCLGDGDCEDGTFCNGAESCDANGDCQPGADPCPGQLCREADDMCVNCLGDGDCADGTFCNGAESCDANGDCQPGSDPCPGQLCREGDDMCVNCLGDGDCTDGTFCNGVESCDANGDCQAGGDPCPGQLCREADDMCVNCLDASDCADGAFCNGMETCDANGDCQPGADPCTASEWCHEATLSCVLYGDGDFDGDGDIDLLDFQGFQQCFDTLAINGCEPGNMTGDGMIDLSDLAAFVDELSVSGPQNP